MKRRDFVRLGLLAGAAYLGRAQVAVPGLWRSPLTYTAADMTFEEDLVEGWREILFSTGYKPNALWMHPSFTAYRGGDAYWKILDDAPPFDAPLRITKEGGIPAIWST